MAQILLSTTGTLSPVVIGDLGGATFVHPTVDFLMYDSSLGAPPFLLEDIGNSLDLQDAVDAGYITLKDENGDTITTLEHLEARAALKFLYQEQNVGVGEELVVDDGETVITFGDVQIDGTLTVNGSGEYINISGDQDKVVVFDDNFIMKDTPVKILSDGRINVPEFTSQPTSADKDYWFTNIGGQIHLNFKTGGQVYQVELSL